MLTIVCPACGALCEVGPTFCLRCGGRLAQPDYLHPRPPNRGAAAIVGVAVMVLCMGGGGVMFPLRHPSSPPSSVVPSDPGTTSVAPEIPNQPRTTCTTGDDCEKLGRDYAGGLEDTLLSGYGAYPTDLKAAFGFFSKACYGYGLVASCVELGHALANGLGTPEDDKQAATVFQRACSAQVAAGCGGLASLYEKGKGVPVDLTRALSLYDTACQGDDYNSCRLLAARYVKGDGVAKDGQKAIELYTECCHFGEDSDNTAADCLAGAKLYETGMANLDPDLDEAASLYDDACQRKSADGCVGAARILLTQGPQKLDKALRDENSACQLGNAHECMTLAERYQSGDGVVADPAQAVLLYRQGCQSKDADACQALSSLCASVPSSEPGVSTACQTQAPAQQP